MKNYCDICFTCNGTESCHLCNQSDICSEFKKCFDNKPYIMWGEMASFDDILICVEKWRLYNGQTTKQ
jgi:hypothetical protein